MTPGGMCACGMPLHYESSGLRDIIERICEAMGEDITVTTPRGSWNVPRHYIALHGLKANELPELAQLYSFERVDEKEKRR